VVAILALTIIAGLSSVTAIEGLSTSLTTTATEFKGIYVKNNS